MNACLECGARACGTCPVCRGYVCEEHWLGGEGEARSRWVGHKLAIAAMMMQTASGDKRLAAEWVSRMFEEGVFGAACTRCWRTRFTTLSRTVPTPPPSPASPQTVRARELLRRSIDRLGTVPVAVAVELVEGAGVRPATFEYYEVQRNGWTGSKKKVGPLTGERWVTSWTSERRSGWGPSGGETYYDVPGTWFTRSVYVSGDGRALTNVPATDVEIVLEQGLEVADPTRRWKQLAPPLNSILAMAADYAGL